MTSRTIAIRRSLQIAVTFSTIVAIVGVAIALFFNPLWVSYAQDRAGVPGITGYTPEQTRIATGAILHDVVIGPPEFAMVISGDAVLGPTERSHMVDVHGEVRAALVILTTALAILAIVFASNRGQAWPWRAAGLGARLLVAVGAVMAVAVLFFFDAAFLLFHRVFFAQGNFTFDPRTQRLVQLFPDQFWVESVTGVVLAGLAAALVVALVAGARARALASSASRR